jgi:hypothetical protein
MGLEGSATQLSKSELQYWFEVAWRGVEVAVGHGWTALFARRKDAS